mmetsp:Transcript_27362/g.49736  ORF Transcript_27362/g.49736 Transcript_27362/m.49736 type:complete len:108 (-) Transcript_27362:120-443(-)
MGIRKCMHCIQIRVCQPMVTMWRGLIITHLEIQRWCITHNISFILRCDVYVLLQWIPVQLLNFQFVPVRHQLNVVLLTNFAWTALLSAWYPPEEEKVEEESNDTMNK